MKLYRLLWVVLPLVFTFAAMSPCYLPVGLPVHHVGAGSETGE